jgi:uncharacterized protein (DUF58 family)
MPTRSGWAALVAAAAIIGTGRMFGVLELYVLGVGIALLVVLAWARVRLVPVRLHVERQVVPSEVHAGTPADVQLVVRAERRTPELDLWEPVDTLGGASMRAASLPAHEQLVTTYRIPTARRGRVSVGPLQATVTDPFGLARRRLDTAPTTEILVLPHVDPVPVPVIGSTGPLGTTLTRWVLSRASGSEFHAQRAYVPGDDLRRVNWRASARADDLVVVETAHEADVRLHVLLDRSEASHPDAASFERAVSAVASLLVAATGAEVPTELSAPPTTALHSGHRELPLTLSELATLEVSRSAEAAILRHEADAVSVDVVVTGQVDAAALERYRTATAGAAARVLVCCGALPSVRLGDWLVVDASADGSFAPAWSALVGTVPYRNRRRPRPRWNPDRSPSLLGAGPADTRGGSR